MCKIYGGGILNASKRFEDWQKKTLTKEKANCNDFGWKGSKSEICQFPEIYKFYMILIKYQKDFFFFYFCNHTGWFSSSNEKISKQG